MNDKIKNTLYYFNEDGFSGYDLSEVQLLENKDPDRIINLIQLISSKDKYISYQAMLVLISWNIKEGFVKFEQFFKERWDKNEEFEPHRIHGLDNVYDVIAQAFRISLLNNNEESILLPYLKELLSIYNEVYFESNFKSLLLNFNKLKILVPNIVDALVKSYKSGMYYQSSQLAPVVVTCEPNLKNEYLELLKKLTHFDNRIELNIKELESFQ